MNRPLPLLALVALMGCASSSSQGIPAARANAPATAIRGAGAVSGTNVMVARDAAITSAPLAAPVTRVWPLVSQVYADIGLPINTVDEKARLIGATNQRVRRIMGKGPASYFNCPGAYGNAAGRDDVFLSIRTQVLPDQGSGTIVRTEVSAVAKSTTSANSVTDCTSNGELEKLIARKLEEALPAG